MRSNPGPWGQEDCLSFGTTLGYIVSSSDSIACPGYRVRPPSQKVEGVWETNKKYLPFIECLILRQSGFSVPSKKPSASSAFLFFFYFYFLYSDVWTFEASLTFIDSSHNEPMTTNSQHLPGVGRYPHCS